jgi:hypothetical protein
MQEESIQLQEQQQAEIIDALKLGGCDCTATEFSEMDKINLLAYPFLLLLTVEQIKALPSLLPNIKYIVLSDIGKYDRDKIEALSIAFSHVVGISFEDLDSSAWAARHFILLFQSFPNKQAISFAFKGSRNFDDTPTFNFELYIYFYVAIKELVTRVDGLEPFWQDCVNSRIEENRSRAVVCNEGSERVSARNNLEIPVNNDSNADSQSNGNNKAAGSEPALPVARATTNGDNEDLPLPSQFTGEEPLQSYRRHSGNDRMGTSWKLSGLAAVELAAELRKRAGKNHGGASDEEGGALNLNN